MLKRVDPMLLLKRHPRTAAIRCIIAALLVGVIVTLTAAAGVQAQGGATVRIDPSTGNVTVNATTVVNVRIENVSNLAGAEIHLTYNPSIVRVESIQAGGFPPADFVAQSSFSNGKVDYAIAVLPQQHQPVSGSGTLLQITLRGLALGQSPLNFTSVILAASGGTQIASTSQNGTLVVGQGVPPTTGSPTTTQPSLTPTATRQPSATPQPGVAALSIVPSTQALQLNASGTVTVRVDNPVDLWGIDVRVSYDQAIVACPNPPTQGTVPQPDIVATNACTNSLVQYAVTERAPTAPANSSGTVFQVTLQCVRAGTSPLNFQVNKLVDRNGRDLPVTVTNAQITCQTAPPPTATYTPTPPPSPTATPSPTVPPLPSGQILGTHYVLYGETLFCIGRAYGVSPWSIASENGLYNPNFLTVGQKLAIPNVPWQSPPGPVCARQFGGGGPPPPPVPRPPPTGCRASYLVRYGDTLFSIAMRYRTWVGAIAAANNLYSPNWIFAGQWLCIPYYNSYGGVDP
ncbi:MAG: LysM peptidoglycan-binding domain-containing protein [Acidobacteriota bacterium]